MHRTMKKCLTCIPVLLVLLVFQSPSIAQDTKPFIGTWNGTLSLPGQEMEITIDFSMDEENQMQGNIDVPAQGAVDIPLGEFNIEGKKITFMIVHPQVSGDPTFTGELEEDGNTISGEYSQSGVVAPFSVKKE